MRAEDIPKLFEGGPKWAATGWDGDWAEFYVFLAGVETEMSISSETNEVIAVFDAASGSEKEMSFNGLGQALTWLRERYREHWRNLGLIMGMAQ